MFGEMKFEDVLKDVINNKRKRSSNKKVSSEKIKFDKQNNDGGFEVYDNNYTYNNTFFKIK